MSGQGLTYGWLLLVTLVMGFATADLRASPPAATSARLIGPIDENQVSAAGIRRVVKGRLTLYTDLPPSGELDELHALIDRAYDAWCAYFQVPAQPEADWHMRAFLMSDRARFRRAGVLPPESVVFRHGYAWGTTVWLDEQPSEYYRRHLLLHEGTHAFMLSRLKSCGPPWLAEGMAELLATHRWENGRLVLGIMPRSRDETPQLGRIKQVRDETAAGRRPTLEQVMNYDIRAPWDNDRYAWSWAFCALLEGMPRYRATLHSLFPRLEAKDVDGLFRAELKSGWSELHDDWAEFTSQIEHGYDIERAAIQFAPGAPLPREGKTVEMTSDRGWQSARITLQSGQRYRLEAAGQFTIVGGATPWTSEANGVSIRYHAGQLLGKLLAVVRPDEPAAERASPFSAPLPLGSHGTLSPTVTGTLYLKLNDAPSERADNRGSIRVRVIEAN
ncbi:MAG: hypothetical protein JSS27_09895 [Planctomycetes bacterium]|nr:hypothetical protein [Planctomycetota bacterium]